MRRPNFFIVGAAKSGTTSMQMYLGQHPEIAMPQKREPIFFGRDLTSHTKRTVAIEDYLGIFSGCGPEKIVGEKTVWYLYSKTAADEISEFDRNAKILIMLRNPVEMVHSLHRQFLSTGNEDTRSFDKALGLEEERAAGRGVPRAAHFPEGLLYSQVPLYCDQVARYFRAFGKEQVQVIIFDEFSSNTAEAYFRTLAFLGVRETYVPRFVTYNKKRKPRLKGLDRIGKSPSSPLRLLPASLRWRLHQINRVEEKAPPMSPITRASLQQLFRPDVERLSELLDRDLTHWCRQDVSGQSAATTS
ncbi:sulfotransferase domain-containing protein [Pelagibius marinus]|uniref:sulfotransferase domain-containing protein n=1 Tax=Pelagibius marinus TaxID=2762760 RepID=UPI0018721AE9|nr:sulfotransferase domain-containing protein [Pelagibius marinus]